LKRLPGRAETTAKEPLDINEARAALGVLNNGPGGTFELILPSQARKVHATYREWTADCGLVDGR